MARRNEFVADAPIANDETAFLREELERERAVRQELVEALEEVEQSAAVLERRISEQGNLRAERLEEQLIESRAETRTLADALARARALLQESRERIARAERRVEELEDRASEATQYVADVLNQLNEKHEYAVSLATELEAVRKAALADKLVTRDYVNSLKEQVEEIPALREAQQQLIVQTEDLIAAVQMESSQFVMLIDTVQSSHFWRFKRFLNRVRARILRR